METLIYTNISTTLPYIVRAGASIIVQNKAFIFDDTQSLDNRQAIELDLDTYEMKRVGLATLPLFKFNPSAVWDGNFGYVIGGYESNNWNATIVLIQFNPKT